MSDANRQAKFYRRTRAGHRHLEREKAQWTRVATAVARILDATS